MVVFVLLLSFLKIVTWPPPDQVSGAAPAEKSKYYTRFEVTLLCIHHNVVRWLLLLVADTVRELLSHIPAGVKSDPPSGASVLGVLGNESGMTPLHFAAYSGNENVVRLLLNSAGVQVDASTVENVSSAKMTRSRMTCCCIRLANVEMFEIQHKIYYGTFCVQYSSNVVGVAQSLDLTLEWTDLLSSLKATLFCVCNMLSDDFFFLR